jgi:SecD/SecF fusion protein
VTDRQRNGFILLLVVGLLAGSLAAIFTQSTRLGLDLKGGVELVYQGRPTTQQRVVTQDALQRAVDIMRQRVDQLGVSEPEIQRTGADQISVGLPGLNDFARAEKQVGTTARLKFFDWEANALTPNGKPVADQLLGQDQAALQISQGGSAPPGDPGGGSMSLYDAVRLAAQQPEQTSNDNTRLKSEYYIFGAPGSAACAAAATVQHKAPVPGAHCLLAGPDDNLQSLDLSLPAGVAANAPQTEQLTVKQGTIVVQAVDPKGKTIPPSDPSAQFFVLRDHAALQGTDISDPKQSTDQSGNPDVSFGFNGKGGSKFQTVTRTIAQRGFKVSIGGQLNQHFAIALDRKLVTVPQIDYKTYPEGITGDSGADITGGFTIQSAQDLATLLRLGALPIDLKLISQSQVSATLGKQALHQGLIAGAAGLIVVALFLLLFYRMLGLIATAALAVYAMYFYALIKLIPITLTLPGIAGLILTIGVAADANIVIFERVKEEVRAGRSIRQGIITGYKKGLTAIIDANVVTLMTAFILFVLATAGVKGFAFTLGIGTIVSLFTAVMATQAILMSMGSSRLISRPSALGVSERRRTWRFDFMGASRYFFSMSGVILLVGALSIGGRGLNLGIDFTSGTRITTGLVKPASESQIRAVMSSVGASDATVQRASNKELGKNGFLISSKNLQPSRVQDVKSKLDSQFGIATNHQNFSNSSVGPTFGKTVANSAVLAIIASLLVISAYIALRFEWKFAVPVLIALMHDLLITSGVYSLTGREVTTATVAALLTILGYSLYDTIIVFDRVRENVPRMPRAAFSQIVNRSMSEVLTRSAATTLCTLLPVAALLLFGGSTLKDFAFALLIGVASGAYSSIFIASPVLTHWKEREHNYEARRRRIEDELGYVPAYAAGAADVEPERQRLRRPGRLTQPEPETVSAAEFEQMKRDLEIEQAGPARATSTRSISKRLAHTAEDSPPAAKPVRPAAPPPPQSAPDGGRHTPAPDIPENEGVAPVPKPKPAAKSRQRNRRHGRRR